MALTEEVMAIIKSQATEKKLRLDLLMAMVEVESSGNPYAMRYERNYSYYYRPEVFSKKFSVSLDTEKALQRFSYGLMQVMGGTARYIGYEGRLLDLVVPEIGIEWGARYLKNICREYLDIEDQIAFYNGGFGALAYKAKNPERKYPDMVQRHVEKVLKLLNFRVVK